MRSHAARQLLNERRSTLSGSNPLTVVMPPHPEHPELPAIIDTAEDYQESQESNAAALPGDEKHFVSSSPSSLSVLSIPSISEPQPRNSQTSQTELLQLKTLTMRTPLQHRYNTHTSNTSIAHSMSEGILRTHSSHSLHRPPLKHRFSEPLSSSCSRLELPPQGHSSQSYYMNHTNVAHPNGNRMTIHHHPMNHSASQEYYHQPHNCGCGHPLIPLHSYGSPGCSPSDYVIEEQQNDHFGVDLSPPTTVNNCVENHCPHCGFKGIQVPHRQPTMIYTTHVIHHGQSPTMTVSSSQDNQLPSAICASSREPPINKNPADGGSEPEHSSSTNGDQEQKQASDKHDKNSHNKAAASSGYMKSMELSDCRSKNKSIMKRRPHSATGGAGNAVNTTTGAKHSLHASADNLTENSRKDII